MKIEFTHWIESDGMHLGFLNEFPDHWTQGTSFEDLKEHLADLHEMFSGEQIPEIRHVSVLEVASS